MFGSEKKHFTNVIKNESVGELLLWRYPVEDFNTGSTLIVMPGETAVFVHGGIVEQVFENGTFTLSTENYPFISRLRTVFSGSVSTFNCVVYFFRKSHSEEILWGTASPIQVRDKVLGIATKIRGRGSYKVQIENPALFLEKLVGNTVSFQSQVELNKYFGNEFQSKIKSAITKTLNETDVELLGLESRLDEFGKSIEPFMNEILADYGLKCVRFAISALTIEDSELRERFDSIGMDAYAKLKSAQADKAVMQTLGEDWGKQQAATILTNISNNQGSGGLAAVGAGIGMGATAGNAFGALASQMFAPNSIPTMQNQASSQNTATSTDDPIEKLSKLKKMLDAGLIEQSEYDAKKSEILSAM